MYKFEDGTIKERDLLSYGFKLVLDNIHPPDKFYVLPIFQPDNITKIAYSFISSNVATVIGKDDKGEDDMKVYLVGHNVGNSEYSKVNTFMISSNIILQRSILLCIESLISRIDNKNKMYD